MERVVNFQSEFANVICKIVVDQVNIVFRFFQSASVLFFSQSASFRVNILLEKKYYYEKIMYRIFFFQSASFLFFSQSASFLCVNIFIWKKKIIMKK